MNSSKVLRSSTANTISVGSTGATAVKRGQVTQCQLCNKKFGTFVKEHQCKRCTRAVCDDCSKNKAKIIGYEVKPSASHRICKFCKEESDFQNELRVKNNLVFSTNSEIGIKWCTNLQFINEQTKNLDLSNLRQQYEEQTQQELENPFSLTQFRRNLNYSQLEFFYYIVLKEGEEKIDLIVNILLSKLHSRLQFKSTPPKLNQLVFYLLAFCSDYVAYHIIIYLYEHLLPSYAKEFLTSNKDLIAIESDIWTAARQILTQSCIDIFKFNEAETKAINAFILNEGREIISTMMIKDINVQCFHHLFEEMMSTIQFEEWEKSFLSLLKFNVNSIRDPKIDTHLGILRNTRIMELKKIKKDHEGQFKNISLIINERQQSSKSIDLDEVERLKDEFQKAKEQLEKKNQEINELKSTIVESTPTNRNQSSQNNSSNELNYEPQKINEEELEEFENKKKQFQQQVYELQQQKEETMANYQKSIKDLQTQLELQILTSTQNSKLREQELINQLEQAQNEKDKIIQQSEQKKKAQELIMKKMEEQIKEKEDQILEYRKQVEQSKIKNAEMQETINQLNKKIDTMTINQEQILKENQEILEKSKQDNQTLLSTKLNEYQIIENQNNIQLIELNKKIQDTELILEQEKKSYESKNLEQQEKIKELQIKLKSEIENVHNSDNKIKQLESSLKNSNTESQSKIDSQSLQITNLLLEISVMKEQNNHFNQQQQDSDSQIEKLIQEKQNLEKELNKMNEEITKHNNQEKELKLKNDELQEQIQQKQNNFDQLNEEHKKIINNNNEFKLKQQLLENENTQKNEKITSLEEIQNNLNQKNIELTEQITKYKSNITQFELDQQQLQEKFNNDISQIQRENKKLINDYETKINEQKIQFDNQIRETIENNSGKDLQEQIEQLKESYAQQNKELKDRQQELQILLETEKNDREKDLIEFQNQNQLKKESINQIIKKHEEEIIALKKSFEDEKNILIQKNNQDQIQFEEKLNSKSKENIEINQIIINLEQQLKEKETLNIQEQEENERLKKKLENIIQEHNQELESLNKINEDNKLQVSNNINEQHNQQIKKLQQKHQDEIQLLNLQLEQLKQSNEQYKQSNEQIILNLNNDIESKNKIIDEISIQMLSSDSEKESFKEQLQKIQNEKDEIQQQLNLTNSQVQSLQLNQDNNVKDLTNQNIQIQSDLSQKIQELLLIQQKVEQSEKIIEEQKELMNKQKIEYLEKEQIQEEKLKQSQIKEQELWEKLEQKNQMINTFYENQNQMITQNEILMQQNNEKYEQDLKNKNDLINSHLKEITLLNSQITSLQNEKQNSLNTIQNLEQDIQSLKQQMISSINPEEVYQQKEEFDKIIKTHKEESQKQQISLDNLNQELSISNNKNQQLEQQIKKLESELNNFIQKTNNNDGQILSSNDIDSSQTSIINSRNSVQEIESSNQLNISNPHIPKLNIQNLNKEHDLSSSYSPRQPNSATTTKIMELQIQVRSLETKNLELKENLKAFKDISKINTEMKKLLDQNRKMMKDLENQLQESSQINQQLEKENNSMRTNLTDYENFEEKILEMRQIDMNRFEQVKDKIEDLKEVAESKTDMINIIQMFALNFKKELDEREDRIRQYFRKLEKMTKDFSKLQEEHEEMSQLLLTNHIDISQIFNKEKNDDDYNSQSSLSRQNSDLDRKSISSDIQEFNPPYMRVRPNQDPNLLRNPNASCTGGDCNIF